jgi:hypothetical protein
MSGWKTISYDFYQIGEDISRSDQRYPVVWTWSSKHFALNIPGEKELVKQWIVIQNEDATKNLKQTVAIFDQLLDFQSLFHAELFSEYSNISGLLRYFSNNFNDIPFKFTAMLTAHLYHIFKQISKLDYPLITFVVPTPFPISGRMSFLNQFQKISNDSLQFHKIYR